MEHSWDTKATPKLFFVISYQYLNEYNNPDHSRRILADTLLELSMHYVRFEDAIGDSIKERVLFDELGLAVGKGYSAVMLRSLNPTIYHTQEVVISQGKFE